MAQPREIFAKNLMEKRRSSGLSQAKLAEKVNVSTHHIAMIELARNFPSSDLMERITEAFGIKIYEMFLEDDFYNVEMKQFRKDLCTDFEQLLDKYIEKQ
jgi:ribosome-binding protein aMBF1 (putative translation factor)